MTTDHSRFPLLRWLAILSLLILTGACVPQDLVVSPFETVVVCDGEDIHIRSLEVLTGIMDMGIPRQRAVGMALTDYGPIKGHKVSMGTGLDTLCTAQGGAAAAETVIGASWASSAHPARWPRRPPPPSSARPVWS